MKTKRLASETSKTLSGPRVLSKKRTQSVKTEALDDWLNGFDPFVESQTGPIRQHPGAVC
jgi:hypothetical protein